MIWRAALSLSPNAEHFMGMPARSEAPRRWTREDVRALRNRSADGARYELVGGNLLVTPSPSGVHQEAVALLWAALRPYVRRQGVGLTGLAPRDVDLEPDETAQPDVFVIPPDEIDRYRGSEPVERLLLAAEVISPSSARGDRVDKRVLYQRHGVSEYWIVDVEARVIERWRPSDDRPEISSDALSWLPVGATEPFRLDLVASFDVVHGENR
jgi:Uma2 family endonuclease